ncbi:MAG: hypothetical protein LBI62_06185, partial [Candidatus Accumulibacter sp.]|nr:hypothetical protein [Accumulibacter sp.]
AWEREFNGTAKAKSQGESIDPPSIKGDTVLLEFGAKLRPSPGSPLTIEFGVQARDGKHEGVSGNLRLEYRF